MRGCHGQHFRVDVSQLEGAPHTATHTQMWVCERNFWHILQRLHEQQTPHEPHVQPWRRG